MRRTSYRPVVLVAGFAAGLSASVSACALLSRAAPPVSLRNVTAAEARAVPGLRPAGHRLPPIGPTAVVKRRPLIRQTVALAAIATAPLGARTELRHPVWLRAHTPGVLAPVGAPVELERSGRRLVGVVGGARAAARGSDLLIVVDGRPLRRFGLPRRSEGVAVMLRLPLGTALSVAAAAVVDAAPGSGTPAGSRWVWRVSGGTTARPVAVTLGPKAEGFYVVRSGLEEGARVAIDPEFLGAARSRLGAPRADAGHFRLALGPDPFGSPF